MVLVGAVVAIVPVALGRASVLYTFYPPLIGSAFYYLRGRSRRGRLVDLGRVGVDVGFKRGNAGPTGPLAMFANVAGSLLWGWTAVGACWN